MRPANLPVISRGVKAVAIGGSAGSSGVLREILRGLSPAFPVPIVVVVHLHPDDGGLMAENLGRAIALPVVVVQDKMPALPGRVHVAPADYHLLAERGGAFALSVEEPVLWSRPSIDVFLRSAARAFGSGLLAILLSGANEDGAAGMREVRARGGQVMVQDPGTAVFPRMPQSALVMAEIDRGRSPAEMAARLECLEREGVR